MKVLIENYGCELNASEMNALMLALDEAHIDYTTDIKDNNIDAVVINTCSVRGSAEERVLGRIAHWNGLKKINKNFGIFITGCMAERLNDNLYNMFKRINKVIPNNDKSLIPLYLEELQKGIYEGNTDHNEVYQFAKYYAKEGTLNAYVPIMNGCNNFCTYCIVPYVRGREISRNNEDIINELKRIDSFKNTPVVTLLGQNVNSYSYNNGKKTITFADLVKEIDAIHFKHIKSIRFESPHPKDFSDELIEILRKAKHFSHHFHIPIQSGNTRILQMMNRRYTREEALELFEKIRTAMPDATFSLDLMVGFPTETKSEFNDTLRFVKEVGPLDAFMYYWNKREGTAAEKIVNGVISEEQRKDRLEILIAFERANATHLKQKRLGMRRHVCVKGPSRNNKDEVLAFDIDTLESVVFKSSKAKRGDVVRVKLLDLVGNTYKAKVWPLF